LLVGKDTPKVRKDRAIYVGAVRFLGDWGVLVLTVRNNVAVPLGDEGHQQKVRFGLESVFTASNKDIQ
jgi:hypothetical protein